MIPPSPLLSAALLPQIRRFWPLAAGLGGGVILLESSHGALSSVISLSAAAAGFWLLSGRLRPSGRALPTSVEGWLERCQSVLESFERLEPDGDPLEQQQRREQLEQLRQSQDSGHLQVALVGQAGWSEALQAQLLQHCPSPLPLRVLLSQPLPPSSAAWHWPDAFRRCDLIVYRLSLPLLVSQAIYRMRFTKYVLSRRQIADAQHVRAPIIELDDFAMRDIDQMLEDLQTAFA